MGETAYSFPPRRYPISPGVLQKGNNRIEMRLLCRNGKGRFTPGKPYGLYDASGCFLDLSGEWKYKKAVIAPPAPEPDFLCRKATGLYNGMVHPLKGMTIRGILWYQGEANGQNPSRYGACLHRLIGEYRRIFSDSLLPFVVLQLPACDIDIEEGEAWPLLRNAQLSAAAIPGVSVTVNLDLGEANDLHPLDKKGAAHRAFLAMKKMTAGWKEGERKEGFWKNTVLGPRLIKYHWQGDRITLHFEAEGELSTKDKKACGEFFVRTSHGERMDARKAYPHNASIDLIFPGLSKKRQREVSLYYAWHRAPLSGLICDEGGLPLTPFCIRIQKEREICESL